MLFLIGLELEPERLVGAARRRSSAGAAASLFAIGAAARARGARRSADVARSRSSPARRWRCRRPRSALGVLDERNILQHDGRASRCSASRCSRTSRRSRSLALLPILAADRRCRATDGGARWIAAARAFGMIA